MYDEKVISRTIDVFEQALPGKNRFVILKTGENIKYVNTNSSNIFWVQYDSRDFWAVLGNVSKYSYIIIHYLTGYSLRFVNRITHPAIVWVAWGADLYADLLSYKGYKLYFDKSVIKRVLSEGSSYYSIINRRIRKYVEYFREKRALKHISFFAGVKGDYSLLKRYFPRIKMAYKAFYYYPIDIMLDVDASEVLGNNIIVGHCASPYDNQEEVFSQLSRLSITGRRVIAPLGYGNEKIKKYVVRVGREYLPDNFQAIDGFLPLEDYHKLLFSAGTFIYGNYRQEAVGNILVALFIGGTVFLHPSNILLHSLQEKGLVLFSTKELPQKIDYVLTENEKNNNREIIWKNYNLQNLLRLIKEGFGSNGIA